MLYYDRAGRARAAPTSASGMSYTRVVLVSVRYVMSLKSPLRACASSMSGPT